MKVLIIGAAGHAGIELVRMAMIDGHEVTAVVRDRSKLTSKLEAKSAPIPRVLIGDAFDKSFVSNACSGQDVVINTAGNVASGDEFVRMVSSVTEAVEDGLGAGGRYWFFGGAAALDIPGSHNMMVNYPKIPEVFLSHEKTYKKAVASSLNWSMLCAGPMLSSLSGEAHAGLRVSVDHWPISCSKALHFLPRIATSIAFKIAMPQFTICYEDAARVILDNLNGKSLLAKRRVGVALPKGTKQSKDLANLKN